MPTKPDYYSNYYFNKFKKGNSSLKNWWLSLVDKKGQVINFLKNKFPNRVKLLDYGCGDGLFLLSASKYFDCTGMDFSKMALKRARVKLPTQELIHGSLTELKQITKASFEVITCFDVLEHITNHSLYLKEFWRVLKPNGVLVVSVPITDTITLRWRQEQWLMLADNSHVRILSKIGWQNLLIENGFLEIKNYSSGLIAFPGKKWKLSKIQAIAHYITQPLGLWGLPLPPAWSDVWYMVAIKNPHFYN